MYCNIDKFEMYCNIDSVINARDAAARGKEEADTEMEVTILEP